MHSSRKVFLLNDLTRAIAATYEDLPGVKKATFKTLDQRIQVDDLIVVPTETRHGMTVCKVVETDLDIELDSSAAIEWVVDVVDVSAHERKVADEQVALDKIKSAEIRKKRQELKQALFADQEANLKALAISHDSEDSGKPF